MMDLFQDFGNGTTTVVPTPDLRAYLSEDEMNSVSIMILITTSLSMLGSGSVLACSLYHRRVCYPEIFPTFLLSVADLLAAFFLFITSCIFLSGSTSYPGGHGPCGYIMTIVTSCYTSSFFLTISYALEALFRFRSRLSDGMSLDALAVRVVSNSWMYLAYVASWVIPLGFAILLMVVTNSLHEIDDFKHQVEIIPKQCSSCFADFRFNEKYCWKQVDNGNRWHLIVRLIFLLPLAMVMVVNMILYILIGRLFKLVAMRRGLLSYHQRQEEGMLRKKAMLYQGVFFICWMPSLILGIISFIPSYSMSTYFWLLLMQAILGPLQGVLNSFLYGWRRDSFRRALSERSSLLSTNRTTVISPSLSSAGSGNNVEMIF